MTMSKGAIGNLVNRYRAVLKKCHLMNVFGSLAVAGMLVMGGSGMAEAAELGSMINASGGNYSEDVSIKGDQTFAADNNAKVGIATDGVSHQETSITMADGKKLTVNAESSDSRAYAVAITNGASLSFSGNAEFSANASGTGQARAIRNNGGKNFLFDGNITISSASENEFTTAVDTWSNANADTLTKFQGKNTVIHVTGGRQVNAVQVVSQNDYHSDTVFAADETKITNISKKYGGDNWANVAVVNGKNATLTFSGQHTELSSDNTDYTAQVISLNSGGNVVFTGDDVTLTAKSNYGANGIGGSGSITFNGKKATIHTIITDSIGATNSVGILVDGDLNITSNVDELNIYTYGSGLWNGNANTANGTAGIYSYGDALIEGKQLNIHVVSGQSVDGINTFNPSEASEFYSTAYGIRLLENKFFSSMGTDVNINVSEGYKDAIGLKIEQLDPTYDTVDAQLLGNVSMTVEGMTGASVISATGKGTLVLGSDGKNVTLASSTSSGISKTVYADDAQITFAGAQTTIRDTSTTTQKNYGVYLDKAKVIFGADSTAIEVRGVGSPGTWGYGVDLWNGSDMSFTGKDVSISDYQKAYTAQTVTVRDTSTLAFNNAGNVDIKAESPYGSTAVVVKSGDAATATFKNSGNVTITSAIENPAQFAGTNVIGMLVEKGSVLFTENVNQVNFAISGQGCDYDGTSYSDGTAAIFVQDANAKVDVKAKELNIAVSAAVDPNLAAADQKKYDDAYGIRVSSGKVVVGNATKASINVNESRGTAYGVASIGANSKVEILGDASINVVGATDAYGLYAADFGSVSFGSEGSNGNLTSSGTGIFVDADSSVALNGSTSITAATALKGAGTLTNAGALTLTGNAADFTGTFTQSSGSTALSGSFFGGDVKLDGGTMNVVAAAPAAGKAVSVAGNTVLNAQSLDLSNGNINVNGSGSVVVAEGGTTTFGNGTLTISGGSVTADAGSFISDAYAAVAGAAAGVVGTAGDLYLRLTQGTEYTATQYNDAKKGLFEGQNENAQLTFLNGTLKVEQGEKVVIGGTENNGKVTLNGVTPVVAKDNEKAEDAGATVQSVPDQFVQVVKADDPDKNLLSVGTLEVADSTFSAKGLQVTPADAAQGVTLAIGSGSKITLIGGDTPDGSVIVDKDEQAVKTSATITDGGSLTLGMEGNSGKQMVKLADVTVNAGTLNVNGNGLGTTQHAYDTLALSDDAAQVNLNNAAVSTAEATLTKGALTVQKGADAAFGTLSAAGGTLNVLNSTAHIETLNATGGTLFVDPAYMKIDAISGDSFGSALLVGDGSVVEIGSVAELQAKAAEAGLNPQATASGKGFTLASGQSMLALGKAVQLGADGKIVVDAGVTADDKINGSPVSEAAYFGGGSLLVVDSAIATGGGAIKANSTSDTITVKDGAKLYITDATAGSTYTVASGFADASSTVAGWTGGDLITNRLLDAERIAGTDGSVVVKTSAKKATSLYPDISIPHTLDAMIGGNQNGVNSANAGIAFLSRALEPQFLAEGDVAPTIDGAAQLAYAGGVQASSIAVAQAPARTIQNHLSLASNVAQPGTSLHDDGFDLWAQAIYGANRARDFSAGSLDAGYNSDFAGAVIGGDWTFGAGAGKARVGLAFNVGAGETKSRGDFNSTKNDFDFWGVSLYGGWNLDNVNVIADLGYSASKNELKQDIPSSLGLGGRIKGDVDSSVITAGLKGEYMIKTDVLDVMPHVGVRYMAVKTDSFTTKLDQGGDLFETDSDLQHVWQFPVGVSLSKSIETESGWKVKPQADLSVVPAAGDTKYNIDVRTPGVNASDSMTRRVMDTTSFDGVFGVEVQKDNVSFGLSYNVQASEHQTGQGVTASFMYKF